MPQSEPEPSQHERLEPEHPQPQIVHHAYFAVIVSSCHPTNQRIMMIIQQHTAIKNGGLSWITPRFSRFQTIDYLANSTARISRMTVTLICPGYCMVSSIFLAISRAILRAARSSTSSGRTIIRTSRPAWMA